MEQYKKEIAEEVQREQAQLERRLKIMEHMKALAARDNLEDINLE
jgi:hypothetical protein